MAVLLAVALFSVILDHAKGLSASPQHSRYFGLDLKLVSKELNHFEESRRSPRMGTGDTDRWRINKGLSPPVSVLGAQSWKNDAIPPKRFDSLDTNSTLIC